MSVLCNHTYNYKAQKQFSHHVVLRPLVVVTKVLTVRLRVFGC